MEIELANDKMGGRILFSTDDFFAVAENMIDSSDPQWIPDKYTEFGKWMDGWETRRRRTEGHDWCIIKLGAPGTIHGIEVDTAYFTGNHVPQLSIQAFYSKEELPLKRRSEMGSKATQEEMKVAQALATEKWLTILDRTALKPGYPDTRKNMFKIDSDKIWTHIRVNQFPDGGIARLRVNGKIHVEMNSIPSHKVLDFCSVLLGATVLSWSDAHFGHPRNLLYPRRACGMYDGWETARNPSRPAIFEKGPDGHLIIPGAHWCIIKLASPMKVQLVEIDTHHFKGNYPESVHLQSILMDGSEDGNSIDVSDPRWKVMVKRTKMQPHKRHFFGQVNARNVTLSELKAAGVYVESDLESAVFNSESVLFDENRVSHVKLTVLPDGGVSRLRIYGRIH